MSRVLPRWERRPYRRAVAPSIGKHGQGGCAKSSPDNRRIWLYATRSARLWLLSKMAQTRLPYCSPYRLFWARLATPHSASDRIHAAYARFAWRSMGPRHLLLTVALCVLWPVNFVVMLWMFTRPIGPAVARATGKPVWRQI